MNINVDNFIKDLIVSAYYGYLDNEFFVFSTYKYKEKRDENFLFWFSVPMFFPYKANKVFYKNIYLGKAIQHKTERVHLETIANYYNIGKGHPYFERLKKYAKERPYLDLYYTNICFDATEISKYFKFKDISQYNFPKNTVAFQTRNPLHLAHENILLNSPFDNIVISPVLGETKADDIPADIRMKCYKKTISIIKKETHKKLTLAPIPLPMWFMGWREAILHGMVRGLMGADHFFIGRNHATAPGYEHLADGVREKTSKLFDGFITPIFVEEVKYCPKEKKYNTIYTINNKKTKTICKGDNNYRISGSMIRSMLEKGEYPPEWAVRKEIAKILIKHYSDKNSSKYKERIKKNIKKATRSLL